MEIYHLPLPTSSERAWISNAYIGLTEDELDQLIGALEQLRDEPVRGTAAHYHVSAEDFQTEVTVWVVDPDERNEQRSAPGSA